MRASLPARAALGFLLAAGAAGCSDARISGTSGKKVAVLDRVQPGATVNGLNVQGEDVTRQVGTVGDTYLQATAIYSLREGETVQATLQIAELTSKARPEDDKFRDSLVTVISGKKGVPTRVGPDLVYLTASARKRLALWFRGRDLYILTTREDYEQPRALLRAALQVGAEGATTDGAGTTETTAAGS